MKMKRKSWAILSVAVLATLLLSGCWLFGITLMITYDIEDEVVSTDTDVTSMAIDLTEEDDWKDNKDKLDELYNLLFYGWFENRLGTEATGQIYVYKDDSLTTKADVQAYATLVLDGLVVPANDSLEVPVTEMKLEPVKDLIMEGKFHLYVIATNVPFEIRVFDATVVVIFAVEAIL